MSESFIKIDNNPTNNGPVLFNTSSSLSSTYSTTKSIELSSFTFSTWFCPSSAMNNSNGVIFSIDQLSMQIMWSAGWDGSYGYMYLMRTRPGSGSYYSNTELWANADDWNHIAITYNNQTENVQFYYNGVLRDVVNPTANSTPYDNISICNLNIIPPPSAINKIQIFRSETDYPSFIGGLSDTRLYFRVLSANEIPYNPVYTNPYLTQKFSIDTYDMVSVEIRKDGTLWGRKNNRCYKISSESWIDADVCDDTILAIKSDGTLWGCGRNDYGQLGVGDLNDRYSLTQISTSTDWLAVSVNYTNSCALKNDGTIYTCGEVGYNTGFTYQQYQQYQNDHIYNLTQFTKLSELSGFVKITGRFYGSYLLRNDGTLWSWGDSYMGSGLGATSASDPVSYHGLSQIGTDTDWKDVFAGPYYGFAIKNDGTLWGTGQDSGQGGWGKTVKYSSGQLYYNSNTIYTFVQVGTASDWSNIGCGTYHTLGINNSGDMYIWGQSMYIMMNTLSGLDRNNLNGLYDVMYSNDVNGNFTPTKCTGNFKDCIVYATYGVPHPKYILYPNGMLYNSGYNGVCSTLYRLHPVTTIGLYRNPIVDIRVLY